MPLINNNNKNLYNLENHKPGPIKYFARIYENLLDGFKSQVASTCDRYGSVVAISGDGKTIAVGAPHYSDNTDEPSLDRTKLCGMVKIYIFNGQKWVLKGNPILGPKKNYMLGIAIDINNDGSIIVIGSSALAYGVNRYLDFSSLVSESPASNVENVETASGIKDYFSSGYDLASDASKKAKTGSALTFIANTATDAVLKAQTEAEPDILLSIQDNTNFDNSVISPEGNGYPDLNIKGRGNVSTYEWLEGEWNITTCIDGEEYNIPGNLGATVAITKRLNNNIKDKIACGSPNFTNSVWYRERKSIADWAFALGIIQKVANLVLTVYSGGTALLIEAATMTISNIAEEIDNKKKVNDKILQREKDIKNNIRHKSARKIEGVDVAPYRSNHIVFRNIGVLNVYDLTKNIKAYKKTEGSVGYLKRYNTSTGLSPEEAKYAKYISVQNKNMNSFMIEWINTDEETYKGETLAMDAESNSTITFNKKTNSIEKSDGTSIITISNDYDTSKVNLAISGNGKKIAVGLPNHSITWQAVGVVLIFIWSETNNVWVRNSSNDDPSAGGELLRGGSEEPGGDKYGNSLALNYDGTILAVGSPFSRGGTIDDTDAGNVKVYKWNSQIESWLLHGSIIYGTKNNLLGTSIKLSNNGETLIIGAPGKHINSTYFTCKATTFQEFTRTIKYDYVWASRISEAYKKENEKKPIVTSQFHNTVEPNDSSEHSDEKMPYDTFIGEETEGLTPLIYGDSPDIFGTSYIDYSSKYYASYTKTTRSPGGSRNGAIKITKLIIYKTVIKKRRVITYYDEGQYGFVKVFKFINGDWNQNCFESTESTPIRDVPIIPPIPPIIITELRGGKTINLYVNTEYIDKGMNITVGSSIAEIISDVNIKVDGYYNYSYIIQNKRGHIARFDREVNVIRRPYFTSKDPIIIFKGDIFDVNGNYGVSLDESVEEIIGRSNNINNLVYGDYTLTYEVSITKKPYNSDVITLTRPVRVIPKKIITINSGIQVVRQFNKYKDLGATIKDTDGNILNPNLITTTIPFTTNVVGTYYVTYSAEYTTSVTRKVIVASPYVKSFQSLINDIY